MPKPRRFRAIRADWQAVQHALMVYSDGSDVRPFMRPSRIDRCTAKCAPRCDILRIRVPFAGTTSAYCTSPSRECAHRRVDWEDALPQPEMPIPLQALERTEAADDFAAYCVDRLVAFSDGTDLLGVTAWAWLHDAWPDVDALTSPAYRKRHGNAKWRSEWRQAAQEALCRAIATDYRERGKR